MVYGTYNELVTGANLNQLITGGASHCMDGLVVLTTLKNLCQWEGTKTQRAIGVALSGWWLTYPSEK